MTLKSRLLATALAIGLSTPAAAVTFTVDGGPFALHIDGVTPTGLLDIGLLLRPHIILLPEPAGAWDYMITERATTTPPTFEALIFGDCRVCVTEPEFSPWGGIHGDGVVTFLIQWWSASGVRPQFQLDFALPEGVTLSHMPLPASWVMLASMLGLGGLFRWARRRVAAS